MMFDLSSVVMLASIACIAALFWQFRRLGERAQMHAMHYCKQQKLQYLDIARQRGSFRITRRGPVWLSTFTFGFSSDREHRYEGLLTFQNTRLVDVTMPVYRTPQSATPEQQPPPSANMGAQKATQGSTKSYYESDSYHH